MVHYAIVSIVVPFWGYLIGSLIYNWLNQKRNYNGDYRYTVLDTADTVNLATPQRNLCDLGQHQAQTLQLPSVRQGACSSGLPLLVQVRQLCSEGFSLERLVHKVSEERTIQMSTYSISSISLISTSLLALGTVDSRLNIITGS